MVRNPPSSPLNYPANNTNPIRIFDKDRAPTTSDFQNFIIRDFWIDTSSNDLYFLVDKAINSGTWIILGGSGVSTETLTGNSGGAVGPDGANNIDFTGEAPFTVVGTPGTNSLEIQNDGTLAESYVTDSGTAIPVADVLNVLGGTSLDTAGAGSTVTINAGADLANSYVTDSGTATPAANVLNVSGGTSIDTSGAGDTLTVTAAADLANTYTADSGTATPAANNINIVGSGSLSTSATGSTVTVTSLPSLVTGNIGFTLAAGVFTITGSDGTALSASNPGFVRLTSKASPGTYVVISITAGQSFEDANGTSTIVNNLFGLTTSIAHAFDIPFFIYAVLNDDEDDVAFMISRFPIITSSPVTTKIGQAASAIADTQGSFFSLKAITVTEWDTNPCERIGSFRMTMDAGDDWTISTLANTDGIGLYQEGQLFQSSMGQFGAKASNFFIDNGGTAPTIAAAPTSSMGYEIVNNQIFLDFAITFTGTGVGAVVLTAKMPWNCKIGGLITAAPCMITDVAFAPTFIGTTMVTVSSNNLKVFAVNVGAIRELLNTDAINTDNFFGKAIFPAEFS